MCSSLFLVVALSALTPALAETSVDRCALRDRLRAWIRPRPGETMSLFDDPEPYLEPGASVGRRRLEDRGSFDGRKSFGSRGPHGKLEPFPGRRPNERTRPMMPRGSIGPVIPVGPPVAVIPPRFLVPPGSFGETGPMDRAWSNEEMEPMEELSPMGKTAPTGPNGNMEGTWQMGETGQLEGTWRLTGSEEMMTGRKRRSATSPPGPRCPEQEDEERKLAIVVCELEKFVGKVDGMGKMGMPKTTLSKRSTDENPDPPPMDPDWFDPSVLEFDTESYGDDIRDVSPDVVESAQPEERFDEKTMESENEPNGDEMEAGRRQTFMALCNGLLKSASEFCRIRGNNPQKFFQKCMEPSEAEGSAM